MKISVYSKKEFLFQRFRAKIFSPLFPLLNLLGISPHHLTLFGFISGLAFIACIPWSVGWSSVFLLLHIFFDTLDGVYARHLVQQSEKGAFFDIISDMTVIALTVIGLISINLLHPISGVLYLYVYTLSLSLTIARNLLSIPPRIPIRTRIYFYSTFFLYAFFQINYITLVVSISAMVMSIAVVNDIRTIKNEVV